jgi:hypothetical protein
LSTFLPSENIYWVNYLYSVFCLFLKLNKLIPI